jgi:hypothetical protein
LEIFFQHNREILESLQSKGVTFETTSDELLERTTRRKIPSESLWDKFSDFIRINWFPKAAIPAMAVVVAVVLILVLPKSPMPDNPYYKYLSFEKAPYIPLGDTRVMETEAQRLFSDGMRLYQEDNFNGAIPILERTVELDSTVGKYLLYLGICYYLDHQPASAIESLDEATKKLDTVQRNRALWYLAQAYLLDGDAASSVPILQILSNRNLEYAKEANYVLGKIRKISPGLFEN